MAVAPGVSAFSRVPDVRSDLGRLFRVFQSLLINCLRLLLASTRVHTRPLWEDEDESDNDRCENA